MTDQATREPGQPELTKVIIRRLDKLETTVMLPSGGNGGS